MASLETWRDSRGTIPFVYLFRRFRAKYSESNAGARDNVVSATKSQKLNGKWKGTNTEMLMT